VSKIGKNRDTVQGKRGKFSSILPSNPIKSILLILYLAP